MGFFPSAYYLKDQVFPVYLINNSQGNYNLASLPSTNACKEEYLPPSFPSSGGIEWIKALYDRSNILSSAKLPSTGGMVLVNRLPASFKVERKGRFDKLSGIDPVNPVPCFCFDKLSSSRLGNDAEKSGSSPDSPFESILNCLKLRRFSKECGRVP